MTLFFTVTFTRQINRPQGWLQEMKQNDSSKNMLDDYKGNLVDKNYVNSGELSLRQS